jgi:hypothetical protein
MLRVRSTVALSWLVWLSGQFSASLLVAQALVEGIILMTSDDRVFDYDGPIRKV